MISDRVFAAVGGGLSSRQAAAGGRTVRGQSGERAIRWRQLALRHGTPATRPQGGDRRTARIEEHAPFILDAIKQQPDPTMAELREMLAGRA